MTGINPMTESSSKILYLGFNFNANRTISVMVRWLIILYFSSIVTTIWLARHLPNPIHNSYADGIKCYIKPFPTGELEHLYKDAQEPLSQHLKKILKWGEFKLVKFNASARHNHVLSYTSRSPTYIWFVCKIWIVPTQTLSISSKAKMS